jgi:hypothetical protein
MIIPSTGRVKEITDMMESFGMYTQAEEIHLLAEERDRLDPAALTHVSFDPAALGYAKLCVAQRAVMSECGCINPKQYGHNSYCPLERTDELHSQNFLLRVEIERLGAAVKAYEAARAHDVDEKNWLRDERERLRAALKDLIRQYVNMLESARDQIIALGGDCDSVDVMERGDPYLRKAREALGSADAGSSNLSTQDIK